MQNLTSFFRNPFSDPKISNSDKKKFGEDTLNRIAVQNTGGQFDDMLSETLSVQTALFGGITSVDTNSAIQQAHTKSVDALILAFSKRNTRFNKWLQAAGIDQQPLYEEFFPLGVIPFTSGLTKGTAEQRMQEMVTAITNHTTEAGGATVLAEYQAFLAQYNGLRGEQLTKMGEVSDSRDGRNAAELDWDNRMFLNLLTFVAMHANDPAKLSLYMTQTILRSPQSSDTDGKGRINGHISSGGASLGGVKVHVVDAGIADATSDNFGNYTTQNMTVGNYQVIYSKDGYTSQTETIDVEDEGDTLWNASLVDPNAEPVEVEEEG